VTARATIDFFAAQAAARRRTAVLVAWFALAWAGTIAFVLVVAAAFLDSGVVGRAGPGWWAVTGYGRAPAVSSGALLAFVAAGVTLVTLGGSAWHWARLAKDGPHAIATMVGGVLVSHETHDAAERRLVNVVEEMAIASGLPVPAIYVLPEEGGINAFAAGFSPDRAVIAVTKGAIDALSRDELQGVVAHELSHLLNADARLNLRLVALIGGITVLAFVGRTLLRVVGDGAGRRRVRGGGRVGVALGAAGLALWLAGSVGAFFGRVIRAAVSRQREFLADAAAVQFTRNPEGLAGALSKIALQGSALASAAAPEVSHFFFASGLRSSWLATHPPIEERIRRIVPQGLARPARAQAPATAGERGGAPAAVAAVAPAFAAAAAAPAAIVASVGNPEPRHVGWASELLARLPPEIAAAARSAGSARALACALLADADPAAREAQLAAVSDAAVRGEVARLAAMLSAAPREERMALLDLAAPALASLAPDDAAALLRDLGALAGVRGRTGVFEWAVQRVVRRRLGPALGERPARVDAVAVEDVEVEALEVLSTIAWLGARDEAGARAALDAGAAALGKRGWRPLARDAIRASRLDAALARLDRAAPPLKRRLLEACAACALADGRVVAAEAEVVRAVAASLGLPVPPLSAPAPSRAAGAA
jgi:Zn-dependent protease with chaperone function